MLLTRRAEFSASHVCRNASFSEEENRRLYGDAVRPHGHNYLLEITVQGDPDPLTGMVIDLKELKQIIEQEVIVPFDHRFLNHEVPPFDRIVPTAENIAMEIWRRLEPRLAATRGSLYNVRVHETADLYVDYSSGPAA